MSAMPDRRLVTEAVLLGTEAILAHLPAAYSQELERVLWQGIRLAVLAYAEGQDTGSSPVPAGDAAKVRA